MDRDEFRRTSHAVWDAMARGWDARRAEIEQMAEPVTEVMLERLSPTKGETILDLAAGTGLMGLAAAKHVGNDGRVIVSDFSDVMVEAARRHARELGLDNVESRVLDAEQLDLPDGIADGVVCRWGYMLMADPATALDESRRVLRDGGRLACAVFAGPSDNPWAALPMQVLVGNGRVPPPEPGAPGILALADRERLRSLLTDAGFADPRIEDAPFSMPFSDADHYWAFLTEVAGAVAVVLDQLEDQQREAVRGEVETRLESFRSDGGIELPALAVVASARV